MKRVKTIILWMILSMLVVPVTAQDSLSRVYTAGQPLVYEGTQDLWPYSFLNENGQPDGFNVELIRLLFDRLDIPYTIKIKPRQEPLRDLKAGKADLILGLTDGFQEGYGYYSANPITLLTQSALSLKGEPATIRNFYDLANHQVYVNDSSLCHRMMIDYGWGQNAIPTRNIQETILQMSADEEGELIWNTLSLKWLLHKFQIDNLEITPVNMPHGEYRFMSNDKNLIHLLDSVFVELSSADELIPLQNKWFYPEREEENTTPAWVWYLTGAVALFLVAFVIYTIIYQIQARHIIQENNKRNRRLSIILETSGVQVWTYDIQADKFIWHSEYGQPSYIYTREEFSKRHSAEDFQRIDQALKRLSMTAKGANGEEEEITLDIKVHDTTKDGVGEMMRDFVIAISVLRRDKRGKPTTLIATKKDVTEKHLQRQKANERAMRYQALFDVPLVGIMLFDREGMLVNLNAKACEMYGCTQEEMQQRHSSIHDLLGLEGLDILQADGLRACIIIGELRNEFQLINIYNESQELTATYAICTDATPRVKAQKQLWAARQQLADLKVRENKYTETINDFIRQTGLRLLTYSPAAHTLTIFRDNGVMLHTLTQTRIMTLVDAEEHRKVMHFIEDMDDREPTEIDCELKTSLHVKGRWLHLHIHLLPQVDANGRATEYIGTMRDISEEKDVCEQLAQTEAKTQEVEETKNMFVKNMMQEIRTPLEKVISQANDLSPDAMLDSAGERARTIISNADMLTHIIDNILNLSRLEAHMVEITKSPTNFSELFESFCQEGWSRSMMPNVKYIVENPYDQLIIDIDAAHLQTIIGQVALNAAQHTTEGTIRARCDYMGRRLLIVIEDSGEGMTQEQQDELVSQLESGRHTSSGLGLPICHELLKQMDGNLEINSEAGIGTTVWITLPCVATAIKRKKNT